MNPERWRRVEALFEGALARDPGIRRTFLEAECADDPTIVAEVLSLLAHDADTIDGVDAIVAAEAAHLVESTEARSAAQRMGAYALVRKLGEGGMGSVWLAERVDDAYRQTVAIKLLRTGARSAGDLERFRVERQILARLDHPNIARLLDGGTTAEGLPYLVMERVVGIPLTDYCALHGCDVGARLRIFLEVCEAVDHAHRSLVVHRDLKPSNILVTEEGRPKLLDFGIAKLLESPEGAVGEVTALHQRLFTPDYASPEQAKGEPITTASDVYSLGVVLYELLTGTRPRRLEGLSTSEIERRLGEDPPETASSRVDPRRRGELVGDLDNILRKALSTEVARRYRSVDQLAEDIRRHLAGLPVFARPDTWGYRISKFTRRHRWSVAAGAAAALAAIGFTVALVRQTAAIGRERDRAVAAQREASEVSSFLTGLFAISDPSESRGNQVTARQLLDRGAERIERDLDDAPGIRASLLATMGTAYHGLGFDERSLELHTAAVKLREQEFAGTSGMAGPAAPAAPSENAAAAALRLADALQAQGNALRSLTRFAEAEPVMRRGLEIREARLPSDHPAIAASLNDLGLLEMETNRLAAAETDLRRALGIRRARLGNDHPDVAVTLSNLTQLLNLQDRLEEAETTAAEVLALRRRNLGDDHPDVANSLHVYGSILNDRGRFAESEAALREVVGLRRRILGSEHPNTLYSLNNLASLLHDRGDLAGAEPLYREVLAGRLALFGEQHLDSAVSLNNLAALLEDRGRYAEALPLLERSLAIRRQVVGPQHPSRARALHNLGRVHAVAGELERGRALLEEALAWRRQHLAATHPELAGSLVQLAWVAQAQGRRRDARTFLEEAAGIQEKTLGSTHAVLAETLAARASLEAADGDRVACERFLRSARGALGGGTHTTPLAEARVALAEGDCRALAGQTEAARAAWSRAAEVLRPRLGPANRWVVAANQRLR